MPKKRSWNDKLKLAIGELENKIQREREKGGKTGTWPEREKVEEWNAERMRMRGYGQYCGSVCATEKTQTKAERKREDFMKNALLQTAKSAAFLLATLALIQGVIRALPDSITVNSSVGGRELPIYCVETDKKQVALSFDAAWGNGFMMERKTIYVPDSNKLSQLEFGYQILQYGCLGGQFLAGRRTGLCRAHILLHND